MYPTQYPFNGPQFDFFKPRGKDHSDFLGIEAHCSGYNLVSEFKKSQVHSRERAELPISPKDITSLYPNDLHGLTIQFSPKVQYLGNYGGGIRIQLSTVTEETQFPYDQVARIRRQDGAIVWENTNVPKRKRQLTTKTLEEQVK